MRVVAALLLIAGCATPVGEIPDEDYTWSISTIPLGYQVAYRNLRAGFRSCDGDVAEGELYTDIGEGQLIAYITGGSAGRSNVVVGKMTIKGNGQSESLFRTGIRKRYEPAAPIHRRWEEWARGKVGC